MPSRTIETTSTARYRVVALASALAMVTYLDRAAIGTLAPAIQRDLRLTTVEMGWVFTAFQLAYGLLRSRPDAGRIASARARSSRASSSGGR